MSDQVQMTPAERVAKCWVTYGGTLDDVSNYQALDAGLVIRAIEDAITAERERCARIARNGANFFRNTEKYASDLADDIADAIENGAS